jgi:Fe-S-cluster containining protein
MTGPSPAMTTLFSVLAPGRHMSYIESQDDDVSLMCRACGACCSYSPEWPRFSLESDADIERIPRELVDDGAGRMRCNGDRCTALVGEVGKSTSCAIYAVRPDVCRTCLPGDDECLTARRRFGL